VGLGEVLNFTAYMFAPASLVTPLGALSVIVAAVLSSKFLNERLNLLGKLGCILCIIGSTIIVLHSPKEAEIADLEILIEKARDTTFVGYVLFVLAVSAFIAFYLGPKAGHKNVVIYIVLCSAIGSLTVMSCKALGLAIRDQLSGRSNDFGMGLPYILMLVSAVFIALQMNYLNKALDIFSTSIVTPIYYVIFTSLVIAASAILFKEWKHMTASDIVGDICGFLVVVIAVILLNAFKDMDVSLDDVRSQMRPKRKLVSNGNSQGFVSYSPAEETLMPRQNYGTSSSDSDRNV
jgi:magnesium transporter